MLRNDTKYSRWGDLCSSVTDQPRVDHHKRNLPTIKRHIWILWKLTKHAMTLKFLEYIYGPLMVSYYP